MLNKDQTVTILSRLRSDKRAAAKFIQDPASEWQALGGQLPAGVTPVQFSQRLRAAPVFKDIQATANGQISSSSLPSCTTAVVTFINVLGIGGSVVAATILTGGLDLAIAAFAGVTVNVVRAGAVSLAEGGIVAFAAYICHGH